MLRFKLAEKIAGRPNPSFACVFQPLADALFGIGTGRYIEKALVRSGILHNRRGFASDRQHQRPFSFFQELHEVAGAAAKRGQ
jgi:hypothetical protein